MASKIAVLSLTRDRLDFTKNCFTRLQECAGYDFDHYVFDNGSSDGTKQWLENFYGGDDPRINLHFEKENVGIARAMNYMLSIIPENIYSIIIKMDNDCYIQTDGLIKIIAEIFPHIVNMFGKNIVVSPRVDGINRQPRRLEDWIINGHLVSRTPIVGGLLHIRDANEYQKFRYNESGKVGSGNDSYLCAKVNEEGGFCGYIEDISVQHYLTTDGQAQRYPEYFTRKREEDK